MSGEDQYGDYSRRGEYEGKDPYPRRTTRGTDPYAELGDETNQAGSSNAGRGDGAAYPRSYGRDYSGRGSDYASGSASQDYQQAAGGYPTQQQGHSATQPGYGAAQQGYGAAQQGYGSAQQQGYRAGQPGYGTGQQDYAAGQQDHGQAREYRSYRRGEYRPRSEGGPPGTDVYGGTGGGGGGGREPGRSRRDVIGVIASSLFAVLAVLALVGVIWLIVGKDGGGDDGSQATQQNTSTTKPKQSTEPSSQASSSSNAAAKAPVVVLNGTSTTGLAKSVTDQIKAENWQTKTPGNYAKGVVKKTTVFYPTEDMKTAAENLQKAFPDIAAVEPSDPTMAKDSLTVVLATDWPT
ncbi:MAG TPA: LytR C-terminal domain-containing protein [Actinomycetes bacterium]